MVCQPTTLRTTCGNPALNNQRPFVRLMSCPGHFSSSGSFSTPLDNAPLLLPLWGSHSPGGGNTSNPPPACRYLPPVLPLLIIPKVWVFQPGGQALFLTVWAASRIDHPAPPPSAHLIARPWLIVPLPPDARAARSVPPPALASGVPASDFAGSALPVYTALAVTRSVPGRPPTRSDTTPHRAAGTTAITGHLPF
ncbi:hypothetical protein NDU88_007750 [Pleurodeles waltl]|uniref:Uncharacterized protein n=1 Tax=Pleurodeles waltl TaxID=8319 RepID=A0AAV7NB43_PLEWA|nr:hypothetical protein NDU88_007750 [Pleurodeles waltl]